MRKHAFERTVLAFLMTLALAGTCAALPSGAAAKGVGISPAPAGVTQPGSPYRYVAIHPRVGVRGVPTIVLRIGREDGRVDRWWRVRGHYFVPAVALDLSGGGLSADGRTLVLQRFTPAYPPARSRFAVLDTAVHLSHPLRPGEERPAHAVRRISVPGFYSFDAISPDGGTIYLIHHLEPKRSLTSYEVRALDTASGRLLPEAIVDPEEAGERMSGLPIARATSPDGRWAYTLYDGDGKEPFLHALDTVRGRAKCVDLPQLEGRRNLYLLSLELSRGGGDLLISGRSAVQGRPQGAPFISVDTRTFAVGKPHPAVASASGLPWLQASIARLLALASATLSSADRAPVSPLPDFLAFTETPRRPGNLLARFDVVGRSSQGRPIALKQWGDPSWPGELLVFGCIHGDECAARTLQPLTNGCPDPSADILVVPNLNPDGAAADSRLNARGVDLNRNFPSEWRAIGERWDPQHSGPRPFSEGEARLAARIVAAAEPETTIWFHQHHGSRPYVRAWGPSLPAGREFARLARMPFRAMPWPAGTAPNWQNHRFPDTSSFVVELPRGALEPAMRSRLAKAVVRLGRQVRED
jgi:hypothetical protein